MTYTQAYNKILDAYFKDEINPWKPKFCFCGTLAPDVNWLRQTWKSNNVVYPYTIKEFVLMENALLEQLGLIRRDMEHYVVCENYLHEGLPNYEDALFAGMSAALEVLRSIHIGRGEQVDEIEFRKRKLAL